MKIVEAGKAAVAGFRTVIPATLLATTALGAGIVMPTSAYAQERSYNVPAGPLAVALNRLGEAADIEIIYDADLTNGIASPGLQGSYGPAEALSRLLVGTGLTFRQSGARSYTLERAPRSAEGAVQLGPVRVEGATATMTANGTDGADLALTMTEGTKSLAGQYAQVGGKSAQRLRDIPRSVTVLTAQEIEDKDITTVTAALDQVTGIYVASYNARTPVFYSRGFLMQNLTIDGGSPMRMHDGLQSIINGVGLPNLLAYDHVEVMRGADGLYSGNGDASGTVNLVRKRPTTKRQIKFAAYAGSWDNYRAELDVGGPLNASGTLRARVVAGWQDADSYFTGAYTKDKFGYGIIEWDAGAHTTLSAGLSYDDLNTQKYERTLAWRSGSLGTPENLPILSKRDSWMPEWSYDKAQTLQYFAKASHDFSPDWNLTVNLTRSEVDSDELYGYYGIGINSDAAVPSGFFMRWMSHGYSNQTMADANLKGKFTLFGRQHDVAVGANWSRSDANSTNPIGSIAGVTVDDYLTYYRYTKPTAAEISTWSGYGEWGSVYGEDGWVTSRYGFWGTLGMHIADPVKVIIGGRYSRNENFRGQTIGKFVPYAAVTYDVSPDWTTYASYSEIFEPMQNIVPIGQWHEDATQISFSDKPTTGRNFEGGVKGDLNGGALQAAFSVFYIEKNNVYVNDETQGQVVIPGYGTTYMQRVAKLQTSKGFDAELKGALTQSWQVSAGYTFNVTKNKEDDEGGPILLWAPKHSARVWSTYQLPDALEGLRLGAGVRVFGNSDLRKGYAVIGASADYEINRHLTLGVYLDNLANKTYRVSTSSAATYGNPRNFMVTLRGTY